MKNTVVKDNALINASYNLDLAEQRLILLAIVKLEKVEKVSIQTTHSLFMLKVMHINLMFIEIRLIQH